MAATASARPSRTPTTSRSSPPTSPQNDDLAVGAVRLSCTRRRRPSTAAARASEPRTTSMTAEIEGRIAVVARADATRAEEPTDSEKEKDHDKYCHHFHQYRHCAGAATKRRRHVTELTLGVLSRSRSRSADSPGGKDNDNEGKSSAEHVAEWMIKDVRRTSWTTIWVLSSASKRDIPNPDTDNAVGELQQLNLIHMFDSSIGSTGQDPRYTPRPGTHWSRGSKTTTRIIVGELVDKGVIANDTLGLIVVAHSVLSPSLVAPTKVLVVPPSAREEFVPIVQERRNCGAGVFSRVDNSNTSIRKRYWPQRQVGHAVWDYVGFRVGAESHYYDFVRDTMDQRIGQIDEVIAAVTDLVLGNIDWAQASERLPAYDGVQAVE
ncbi:hypothetical protein H0H81_001888 [Sphagnurus paluster]|uniref:Uncharacterized protein n=1 Tax=Sphagnurus paluster TaxID=117069 RepID=A0A9P7K314_9AGAR|nr:hypothetical protein H0H81_001888 [Sphagnurus paluster]